jgi:hypothetical protein
MSRRRIRIRIFGVLLGSVLTAGLLIACSLGIVSEASSHTVALRRDFPSGVVERVRVDVGTGTITVRADASTESPRVRGTIREGLERMTSRTRLEGHTLVVEAYCRQDFGPGQCRISAEVDVPPGLPVDLHLSRGTAYLRGPVGPVKASIGTGALNGRNLGRAPVRADVGVGELNLRFGLAPESLDVEVNVGDLQIRLPAGPVHWKVDAETGLGGTPQVTGLRLDPKRGRPIRARTGVGSITITGV